MRFYRVELFEELTELVEESAIREKWQQFSDKQAQYA